MSDPSAVAHRSQRLIGHLAAGGNERDIESIRSKLARGSYYITFMSVEVDCVIQDTEGRACLVLIKTIPIFRASLQVARTMQAPSSILFITQRAAQSIAVINKALKIPGREDSILMPFPTALEGQRRWRKDLLSLVRLPAICHC